jgi:hypothetical protein
MDSGWGILMGEGLRHSTESKCIHPYHQIYHMDQGPSEPWGAAGALQDLLASSPALAAAAPSEPMTSHPLFLFLFCMVACPYPTVRVATEWSLENLGPALSSWQGGLWWVTGPRLTDQEKWGIAQEQHFGI